MITNCTKCETWGHEQDKMYGKGQRVHNQMKDPTKARCTVCGNIKTVGRSALPVVKEEKGA